MLPSLVLPFDSYAIARGAALIAAGAAVAVATETVYGLAADATAAAAVAGVYAAKARPSFNPLIIHVADLAAAEAIAVLDDDARALAAAFWPGPLTLVLPLRPGSGVAGIVTAGLDTVAVRVPAHRAMRALIDATGRPLAAPSANRSGGISPTRAAHVVASLGDRVALVIDDGATPAGIESTVVRGCTVLRPGPLTRTMLAAVVPRIGRDIVKGGPVDAPGQLASHYAPAKPLRLDATGRQTGEWLIGFGAVAGDDTLSAAGDLTEAAARLFDALHRADASPAARIAVAPVVVASGDPGLAEAIADRLARAAHR